MWRSGIILPNSRPVFKTIANWGQTDNFDETGPEHRERNVPSSQVASSLP